MRPKNVGSTIERFTPILGTYRPLASLWDSGGLFPSEGAARWFLRRNRRELVQRRALIQHAGRIFIDPDLTGEVAIDVGLRDASRRAGLE